MQKLLIAIAFILVGSSYQASAQNDDFKINVGLSYNYTFTGALINTAIEAVELGNGTTNGADVKKASFPSLQATFDFAIKKYLSVGVAVSYQSLGFKATGNEYFDEATSMVVTEDFKTSFSRLSIAFRPLFHYGNVDRLDMYSGLRIQYFTTSYTDDSNDPSIDNSTLGFDPISKVGVGIIPFGIRYFLTDNIGLGYELNIGRPYVSNISVNARF